MYTWFIAKRLYARGGGGRRASRTAIGIATAGVALGLAVMIIAVAVVLGFKSEVQRRVTGIGGHIQVLNYQSLHQADFRPIAVPDSMMKAFADIPQVTSVQRFCQKSGMLKTDESFQGVLFRGIDADYDLSFLRGSLVDGAIEEAFSDSVSSGRLLVSQTLAAQLRLEVGSKVSAYFIDNNLRARRFTVAAIYATNMSEYDSHLVFCDYKTIHQLLGYQSDESSGVEVGLSSMDALPDAAEQVGNLVARKQDQYGNYFTAPTIKDIYPHIFAWLDLLDLNVWAILLLMIAVAGFTAISGLLIIILEHTQFIGIMKAMGATNRSLRHTFLYYAFFIIGRGLLWGNLLGIGLCLLQQHFGFVHLDASTYYVPVVPVQLSWLWVVVINVTILIATILALVLPSFLVSRIRPAKSIRFE